MSTKTRAEELAERLEQSPLNIELHRAAAELRRLEHNNRVLADALWKACGDDEEVVNSTIESQGSLQ